MYSVQQVFDAKAFAAYHATDAGATFSSIGAGLNSQGVVAGFVTIVIGDAPIALAAVLDLDVAQPFPYNTSGNTLGAINNAGYAVGVQGIRVDDAGDIFKFGGSPATSPVAILLTSSGSWVDLSGFVGPSSGAADITDNGLVCGWSSVDSFVFDINLNAVTRQIPPLPGKHRSVAAAINMRSQVVGTSYSDTGEGNAFVFQPASLTPLTDLGPGDATDINDASLVCGSVSKSAPQFSAPAICDVTKPSPSFVELPLQPGFMGGRGYAINSSGDVVGDCWTVNTYAGTHSAFVFPAGSQGMNLNQMISSPGWHLETAYDINDSGQITGVGTLDGQRTAFVLTPMTHRISVRGLVLSLLGGVDRDGGGLAIPIGGRRRPIPIDPWGWDRMSSAKRDALVALAMDEMATFLVDRAAREKVRGALIEVAGARLDTLMQHLRDDDVEPR